jgi:hypothetical protein
MSVKHLKAGQHNCFGRFAEVSGEGSENHHDRQVLMVYMGKFDSMDGEVDVTEDHIDKLVANHNERLSKLAGSPGIDEEKLTRLSPPLQLDHSTSAAMTVGRVVGKLVKGVHRLEDGSEVPAVYGERVRVLGKENVEKVKDGRWANVSIGADLENGILNELSITPFPAAPNASLLSMRRLSEDFKVHSKGEYKGVRYQIETNGIRYCGYAEPNMEVIGQDPKWVLDQLKQKIDAQNPKKLSGKGELMSEKLKKHLAEKYKMSEEQALAHYGKMKGHMAKKLAAEEDKAEEHMAKMSEEDMSKLADDVVEEDKKLAADKEEKEKKELSAKKAKIVELSKGFNKKAKDTRLTMKKGVINARLSKLQSSAKITPAERKKIDLAKLAAESDAVMNATLKSYEDREPVIDPRVHGTTKAVNLAKLQKDARLARMEAEAKVDFGLPLDDKDKKVLAGNEGVVVEVEPASQHAHEEGLKHLEGMLSGYDQRDVVMAHVKKMLGYGQQMAGENAEQEEKEMSALAESVNHLHTQFQDLVKLVGDVSGIDSAELTE